jgi:SAM-dependent methyltransferase
MSWSMRVTLRTPSCSSSESTCRRSFEAVASAYDEVRPGYPGAVYERIIEFGGLEPAGRVLEVGMGTGKATVPFADRGFEIVGIEPGAALSGIARARLSAFPRVTLVTSTFERWAVERGAFALAFAAQAYHWLDPNLRLARFAQALASRGALAIFGNTHSVPARSLQDDLDRAYEELAPSLSSRGDSKSWYGASSSPVMTELTGSWSFDHIQFAAFEWKRQLDVETYCRLLGTYSDHSALPATALAALLSRIAEIGHAQAEP